jgi:hypothetical protein
MPLDDARVGRIVFHQQEANVLQFEFTGAHRRVLP